MSDSTLLMLLLIQASLPCPFGRIRTWLGTNGLKSDIEGEDGGIGTIGLLYPDPSEELLHTITKTQGTKGHREFLLFPLSV